MKVKKERNVRRESVYSITIFNTVFQIMYTTKKSAIENEKKVKRRDVIEVKVN